MASSDDGIDRKSWKLKKGCHRALLATLGAWMVLTFFSTRHQCQDGNYDGGIVLKRHSISHEPLNLLGRISKAIHTRDDLQVERIQVASSSAQHNRMVEAIARVPKEGITCDLSHFRTDICYLRGDVRVNGGSNGSVALLNSAPGASDRIVAKIKPYTRKWEESCMKTIGEVAVKTVGYAADHKIDVACSVNHSVPAIIFSTGGYTGNLYHEFNDGLIPLFITAEKFKGEVVFLILELHDWWMMKYGSIIKRLSNYPVLDFDGSSEQIHCFPQVTVGLKIHDELAINPEEMEGRKVTMRDFQQLLKDSLNSGTGKPVNALLPVTQRKPRLVLLSRNGSRVILNQNEIIKLAKRIGFEIVILAPHSHTELSKVHELLHSAEVLVGVHGAALTHLLFMRPGSIFIQIIPLGTDWAAKTYYGEPAIKAGLRYVEYKIVPQESSLVQKFGRNHMVVTNPEKITSKGWWEMKKIYLQSQDVIVSLPRFQPILQQAYRQATLKQESA